jgi:hypothetical protein
VPRIAFDEWVKGASMKFIMKEGKVLDIVAYKRREIEGGVYLPCEYSDTVTADTREWRHHDCRVVKSIRTMVRLCMTFL